MQRIVWPHVGGSYPSFIAHTDSCARPKPSYRLSCTLYDRSLQVATSPCWELALPGVISANLSLDAWPPTPAVPMVHVPVSSHRTSAFPPLGQGRHLATSRTTTSARSSISELQTFTYVQASSFARHPGRPYRYAPKAIWQP